MCGNIKIHFNYVFTLTINEDKTINENIKRHFMFLCSLLTKIG